MSTIWLARSYLRATWWLPGVRAKLASCGTDDSNVDGRQRPATAKSVIRGRVPICIAFALVLALTACSARTPTACEGWLIDLHRYDRCVAQSGSDSRSRVRRWLHLPRRVRR